MKHNLVHDMWPSHRFPFSLYEEGEGGDLNAQFQESSGVSVYEGSQYIYVEVYVPGISLDEIEMSLEKGTLQINAMKKKERKKKYHKRAIKSFSYYVILPVEVERKLKEVLCNGILKVVLVKKKKKSAEKIPLTRG